MEQLEVLLTPELLAMVPLVAFVLQMIKKLPVVAGYMEYAPLVSIGLGVASAYMMNVESPIIPGVIIGLLASGSYDVLKGQVKPKEPVEEAVPGLLG